MKTTTVDRSLLIAAVSDPEPTRDGAQTRAGAAILKRAISRLEHENSAGTSAFSDHADYAAHHEFTQFA
jgi:hypothetical protein